MATTNPNPKSTRTPLVEGVDYYLEDGRWVFTETFHLRRGHCCRNGCRHCPYGDQRAHSSTTKSRR